MLDAGHGNLQPLGDPLQGFPGKPMIFGLNLQQYLNERTGLSRDVYR